MEDIFNKLEEASVKLDELSKATLGRYVMRASDDKAERRVDQVLHSSGQGAERPTQKSNNAMIDRTNKRRAGMAKAVRKLTKEDADLVESAAQLDEISKTTLRSYTAKASETLKGRGRKSPKKIQRASNIEVAKAKLTKILNKEYDKHEAEQTAKVDEVHNHFQKEAPKILATHGYTKIHSAADHSTYHKGHDNGHSTMVRLAHSPNTDKHGGAYGSKFSIHSTNGSGTLMGHNHMVYGGDVGEHKIKAVHGFHDAIIRATDTAKGERY